MEVDQTDTHVQFLEACEQWRRALESGGGADMVKAAKAVHAFKGRVSDDVYKASAGGVSNIVCIGVG